jgi:cytochrome P450
VTDIDGRDLIAPRAYAERGIPHEQWTELRRLDHLHFCEPRGFDSFYPVVRHRDICQISKQPKLFWNRRGIVLESQQQKTILEADSGLGNLRAILVMDPPEHRDYRRIASPWFTPRAIQRVDPVAQESARSLVDRLVEQASGGEGECEFANEIATAHPLRILSTILGLPRQEEPRILTLTTQLFASDDPDLQREGEDRLAAAKALAVGRRSPGCGEGFGGGLLPAVQRDHRGSAREPAR